MAKTLNIIMLELSFGGIYFCMFVYLFKFYYSYYAKLERMAPSAVWRVYMDGSKNYVLTA